MIKQLIFALLCMISIQGRCQTKPALTVAAEFTGYGTYHCAYGQDGSYVRLAVRNNTAATRTFFVWSCSWRDCWSMNKTIAYFPALFCNQNIPEEIELKPGQEVVFYNFVQLNKKAGEADVVDITKQFQDKRNEIRFAFTEVSKIGDLENIKRLLAHTVGNTYWSEPVTITFPENT